MLRWSEAHFYVADSEAMAMQAVDGASTSLLQEIAEVATATWPGAR